MGNLPAALVTLTRLSYCSSRSLLICSLVSDGQKQLLLLSSLLEIFFPAFASFVHKISPSPASLQFMSIHQFSSLSVSGAGASQRYHRVRGGVDRVQIRGRANNGSNLFLIIDLLFIYVFMLVSLMEHVQKKGEEMPASEQELT